MTNTTTNTNDWQLSLPITEEAIAIAQNLARQQPNAHKAEQIKLNTLAVSVVDTYLQMMSIPTNVAASDSRNPFVCLGSDVADLMVTHVGRLECRPVKADAQNCHVPLEVWQDRIGYVAVQLDEALEEATLLGFMSTIDLDTEEIPLQQFQPLRTLLRQLHELASLETPPVTSPVISLATPLVTPAALLSNLSQWLQNTFETGWETLETLMGTPNVVLEYSNRSLRDMPLSNPGRRSKRLTLETPQGSHSLILIVTPEIDPETTEAKPKRIITLRVISADPQIPLPVGLRLIILDESGAVFKEEQSRPHDEYLRSRIGGPPGEQFKVQVALDDICLTEHFVI